MNVISFLRLIKNQNSRLRIRIVDDETSCNYSYIKDIPPSFCNRTVHCVVCNWYMMINIDFLDGQTEDNTDHVYLKDILSIINKDTLTYSSENTINDINNEIESIIFDIYTNKWIVKFKPTV